MPAFARVLRFVVIGGLGVLLVSVLVSLTAANSVPTSRAGDSSRAAGPNDLKPASCAAITLTSKVSGSGTFSATAAADLMTGSAVVDDMSALGGNDCLLGGAGNDSLRGGTGTDVCLGGAGTDTFAQCETQIQ